MDFDGGQLMQRLTIDSNHGSRFFALKVSALPSASWQVAAAFLSHFFASDSVPRLAPRSMPGTKFQACTKGLVAE